MDRFTLKLQRKARLEVFQGAMSNLLSGHIVAQKTIWTEVTCHLVGEQAQGFVASTLTENAIQVRENEGVFGENF